MQPEEALVNADTLVDADLKGIDSHGVSRLPIHLKRIKIGIVRANYEMKTVSDRLSAAVIDACNSMGPYVSVKAMELAIEKARHTGVAFVTVKNSNHNGIAAYYAERALPHGMIGIAATNSKARMAVYGGRDPYLGTNPFAVAIPADRATADHRRHGDQRGRARQGGGRGQEQAASSARLGAGQGRRADDRFRRRY